MSKNIPLIPNLPYNTPLVDKHGTMHPIWNNFFNQFIGVLQRNLSTEGYLLPQQTAANISSLNTPNSTGALLYDSDNNLLKVNINGTFKTVTTS